MPGSTVHRRRTWWTAFAAFSLGLLAWSAATPMMASPDEGAHAVRAAGVVRGQLLPERRAMLIESWMQEVPVAYSRTPAAACFVDRPYFSNAPAVTLTPECVPQFHGPDRLVRTPTYEFRGAPHLYLVYGLPSLVWPDRPGMIAMRAMNALASAAFLASALVSALRRPRRRLAALGVLAGATPMTWYIGGLINPNGLENAAAVALWATILPLALGDSDESDARLLTRAGIAGVMLAAIRGLGPGFVLIALVAGAILAAPERRRALARDSRARWWGLGILVSGVVTLVWSLGVVGLDLMQPEHPTIGFASAVGHLDTILDQTVGVFGSNYVSLPRVDVILWSVVVLAGLVAAAWTGTARVRLTLGMLLLATLTLPITTDGFNLPNIGFEWQGRYGLPLTAGLVIVAFGVVPTERARRWVPVAGTIGVGVVLGIQVAAGWSITRRLAMGVVRGANWFDWITRPRWEPSWPTGVLLVAWLLAAATLAALTVPALVRAAGGEEPSE